MDYYILSKLFYLIATLLMLCLLLTRQHRQRRYQKEVMMHKTQIMKESEEKF